MQNCDTEARKSKNEVYRLCHTAARGHGESPLTGTFRMIAASFQQRGQDGPIDDASTLYRADGSMRQTSDGELSAVAVTRDIALKALNWLSPDAVTRQSENELLDTRKLIELFIKEMERMGIPNAPNVVLRKFIEDREWDDAPLFRGETKDKLFARVDSSEDIMTAQEKWMSYRKFISCNMAWTTKIFFLPVEGLHRSAVSDKVFNGIAPPGASPDIKSLVDNYAKKLEPGHPLTYESKSIESPVMLKFFTPRKFTSRYCMKMKNLSVQYQSNLNQQHDHTVVNTLLAFLDFIKNEDGERIYLYSHDGSHGLERVFGMSAVDDGSTRNAFKQVLITDGLCDNAEAAEDFASMIENKEGKEWPGMNRLGGYYVKIWIERTARRLYTRTREFSEQYNALAEIDSSVKLDKVKSMEWDVFQRIFLVGKNKKSSAPTIQDWRLDCGSITKDPTNPLLVDIKGKSGENV